MNTARWNGRKGAFPGLVSCLVLAAMCLGLGGCSRAARQPNILLITLDTTRADRLGCYGYTNAVTPNLDAIAERGILFERAFTPIPFTLPAHTSMLTGLYPPEHGLRLNGKNSLHPSIPLVTEQLQEDGYATGAFVASFVLGSKFGLDRGFDVYDDSLEGAEKTLLDLHQYRHGKLVTDAALQWLGSLDGRQPFFCWIHLYDPHTPYHAHRDRFGDQYVDRPYDAEIRFMDQQIGRVVSMLEERELLSRTFILALGDHGEGLGDHGEDTHGNMLYDSTLRVPMICAWPGRVGGVRRNDDPVSIMSVAPTILDAAGLPFEVHHQAGSLGPALAGESVACSVLYAETDEPFVTYGWSPLRSIRQDRLKYIHTTRPELYDYLADPGETDDLAGARGDEVLDLADRLAETQNGMEQGETVAAHLTPKEQAVLESLGYIGGAAASPDAAPASDLADIKDRIHLVNMVTEAHEIFRTGGTNQALAILVEAAGQAPDKAIFQKYLGSMQLAVGRYDEAIATAGRLMARDPDNLVMLQLEGEAWMRKGDFARAAETYEQGLKATPDAPDLLSNLASALTRMDRFDEAFPLWERALANGGDPHSIRFNMGLAYQQAGHTDRARAQWELLLEDDPLNRFAHEQLRKLQSGQGERPE